MFGNLQRSLYRAILGISLGALAACSDDVIGPELKPAAQLEAAKLVATPDGSSQFRCELFTVDAEGTFHRRTVQLSFPRPEIHEAGLKREYRYDGFSGTRLVRSGTCLIPATDKAIRRLDRLFRLSGRPDRSSVGEITTMDCPPGNERGCYELAPITTIACQGGGTYPDCNQLPEEFEQCDWWNPCGGGGAPSSPGGGGPPPPPSPCWECEIDPDGPCRTGDPIIDSPEVNGIFKDLWDKSNYGPEIPQDQRLEHGAWITFENGRYSAQPMNAVSSPCGLDDVEPKPANAVGMIHTHPWRLGEIMTTCAVAAPYIPVASDEDASALATLGFAFGFILDASGITTIYPNRPGYGDSHKGRCSY